MVNEEMASSKGEIMVEPTLDQPKEDLVAEYKKIFQHLISMRPSGTRNKIAKAIGKNKSFVSQITNPAYSVPIPAKHLETIFSICHFSQKERDTFLRYYAAAHPGYQYQMEAVEKTPGMHAKLVLEVPVLDDPVSQQKLEGMIRDFAQQLFGLMNGRQK